MKPQAQLSISLLGSFKMLTAQGEPVASYTRKTQSLLAILGVESEHPLSRQRAVELLWPQLSVAQGRHNLRQTLLLLQRLFRQLSPELPLLEVTSTHLRLLSPQHIRIDTVEFMSLWKQCQLHKHRHLEGCPACLQRLQELVSLYKGELLSQWNPEEPETMAWQQGWRNLFHQRVLLSLQHLINRFERQGELAQAEFYARRWAELEPGHETAHRRLMTLLAIDGRRAAAIRHYENLEAQLSEQQGTTPELETEELFDQIWQWRLKEPPQGDTRFQLPLPPLTPFIGREAELTQLDGYFQNPNVRMILLSGTRGVGTSRLAIHAARTWRWYFPKGVFYIGLESELGQEALPELLELLRVRRRGTLSSRSHPPEVETLVVLDHADHLLADPSTRALLEELSSHALLLLTTYQRVPISHAAQLHLKGLSVQNGEREAHEAPSEALQLLLDRTRRAIGRSTVPVEWWPDLTAISVLVTGVPWWLELAAHQLSVHTPAEVLQRLRSTPWTLELDLLDVPERRRSPVALAQEIIAGLNQPCVSLHAQPHSLRPSSTTQSTSSHGGTPSHEQLLTPPILHAVMQRLCG